jgi:hypothetical protein
MLVNQSQARGRMVPIILVLLLIVSALGVVISTANDIGLGAVADVQGLSEDETAYYEYVAPRLDRLVVEIDDVVQMIGEKSRDILALTISGNRIEELTREITHYGEEYGVPDRFEAIHQVILEATGTASYTFDQARQALRTFNFSRMTGLVQDFQGAADGLHWADDQLEAIAGGTGDASVS